ncbi:hypothetical protein GCM10020256_55840 [Streptomyces thermocoprophilus]
MSRGAGDGVQKPSVVRSGDGPHVVAGKPGRAVRLQLPQPPGEVPSAVVRGLRPGGVQAGRRVPVELAAGPLPGVQQGHGQAESGGPYGGGEPGGTGAHHGEIDGCAHTRRASCPPGASGWPGCSSAVWALAAVSALSAVSAFWACPSPHAPAPPAPSSPPRARRARSRPVW